MRRIIHCQCRGESRNGGTWYRNLAVLLPDGRLEIRNIGKSTLVSGGLVKLACDRCGFEEELALDTLAAVALA